MNAGLSDEVKTTTFALHGIVQSFIDPWEPRWVIYSPKNGYIFPYPHLLRVNGHKDCRLLMNVDIVCTISAYESFFDQTKLRDT